MLRICQQMCQGVVLSEGPMELFCPTDPKSLKSSLSLPASQRLVSPIEFSTTVLLTLPVPKPSLPWIEHCPAHRVGESLAKQWDGKVCIDSKQAC